jgi:hypothetical protein
MSFIAGCNKSPAASVTVTPSTTPVPGQTAKPDGTLTPAVSNTVSPSLTPSAGAAMIIDKASKALSDVQTYLFYRNVVVVESSKADKSDETTTTISGNASLNLSDRSMQMNNQVYARVSTGQTAGSLIENSIYIINNTVYIQGIFQDNPQMWGKTALTDTVWQLQNQARQTVDLLQPQNVTVLAPETLHIGDLDVPCDVLQVTPDPKELWSLLVGQPGIQLPSEAPPGIAFDQIVKSSDMKLWLAQSDGVPIQATIGVSIQVDPTQVTSLTSTVSIDISLRTQFYDYNTPVRINLPAEAAATDVPDLNQLQNGQ